VRELIGADEAIAEAALNEAGWVVKEAWRRLKSRRRHLTIPDVKMPSSTAAKMAAATAAGRR
jgi:hypothetical protein